MIAHLSVYRFRLYLITSLWSQIRTVGWDDKHFGADAAVIKNHFDSTNLR